MYVTLCKYSSKKLYTYRILRPDMDQDEMINMSTELMDKFLLFEQIVQYNYDNYITSLKLLTFCSSIIKEIISEIKEMIYNNLTLFYESLKIEKSRRAIYTFNRYTNETFDIEDRKINDLLSKIIESCRNNN